MTYTLIRHCFTVRLPLYSDENALQKFFCYPCPESNPVPIMMVQTSTADLQVNCLTIVFFREKYCHFRLQIYFWFQDELFDCQRQIMKISMERNMKAAVINQVRPISIEQQIKNQALVPGIIFIQPPSVQDDWKLFMSFINLHIFAVQTCVEYSFSNKAFLGTT